MTHDDLVDSLAGHLYAPERLVWRDMQLGPSGSARPDVFTLLKSYARPCPTSYEVKASKSDFRSDITAGEWTSYLEFSSAVYFACEAGLITKDEVPNHAGLILLRNGVWRMAKRATLQPVSMPQVVLLKLLIDGPKRYGPPLTDTGHWWDAGAATAKMRRKFGDDVAEVLHDIQFARAGVERAKDEARKIVKYAHANARTIRELANVAPARAELCRILGLEDSSQSFQIEAAVRRFREDAQEHPAARELHRVYWVVNGLLETLAKSKRLWGESPQSVCILGED